MSGEGQNPTEIPQSEAIKEAQVESIADLFSRDPENFSAQDDVRVIEAFRAQRARWEQAEALEASGKTAKKEKTKAEPGASAKELMKRKAGEAVVVDKSLDEMGL